MTVRIEIKMKDGGVISDGVDIISKGAFESFERGTSWGAIVASDEVDGGLLAEAGVIGIAYPLLGDGDGLW